MKQKTLVFLMIFGLVMLASPVVYAQYSSPNYRVEESFFGTGGELDASSPNYRARQGLGELTVGNTASTTYQSQAGFTTTDVELLEVAVNGTNLDLGVLDRNNTQSSSTTFAIRNYLSSGYIVRIGGGSLKNNSGGYQLASMNTPVASSAGTEQFGLNLRANSSPSVGADPVQVPDNSFSFGQAAAGYDTANVFKFIEDDLIAESNKSSGTTIYTISFIANVSGTTPGGEYGTSLFVNVIPTF